MLEGLDRADWGRLTHAWGPALDTPGHIRLLASRDAKKRETARGDLCITLGHQGTRYAATAAAVPFLFELLDNSATPEKSGLIRLLIFLAVGYHDKFLPLGFDPAAEFAEAEKVAPGDAGPEHYDDYGPELAALWARDAYNAVRRRVTRFRALARHRDPDTRRAAVFALAWFPVAARKSAPVVRRICRGQPQSGERANAILCLGILGRYLRDTSDAPWLQKQLGPDRPHVVRVTAAISLAVLLGSALPAEGLAVLLEAVQDVPRGQREGTGVAWAHNGLIAHVCKVLHFLAPAPTEPVLSALCQAAKGADFWPALNVWHTLLDLVFPDKLGVYFEPDPTLPSRNRVVYRDSTRLDDTQRRAVEAIARSPYWEWKTKSAHNAFGPHEELLLAYGLPHHHEKLQGFLAAAKPRSTGDSGSYN
jgi:hypothetical protein